MKKFLSYFTLLLLLHSSFYAGDNFFKKNKISLGVFAVGAAFGIGYLIQQSGKSQGPKKEEGEKNKPFQAFRVDTPDILFSNNFIFPKFRKIYSGWEEKNNDFDINFFANLFTKMEEVGNQLHSLCNNLSQRVFEKYIKEKEDDSDKLSKFLTEGSGKFSENSAGFFSDWQNELQQKEFDAKIISPFYEFLQKDQKYKYLGDAVWTATREFIAEDSGKENWEEVLEEFGKKYFYVSNFIKFIYFVKICPEFGGVIEQNEKFTSYSDKNDRFGEKSGLLPDYCYQSIAVELESPELTIFSSDQHGSFFALPYGEESFTMMAQKLLHKNEINLEKFYNIFGGDFTDREFMIPNKDNNASCSLAIHSEAGELLLWIRAALTLYGRGSGNTIYIPGNHVENGVDMMRYISIYRRKGIYFKDAALLESFIRLRGVWAQNMLPKMVYDKKGGDIYAHALPCSGSFEPTGNRIKIKEGFSFVGMQDNPFQSDIEEIITTSYGQAKNALEDSSTFVNMQQKDRQRGNNVGFTFEGITYNYVVQELENYSRGKKICEGGIVEKKSIVALVEKYFPENPLVINFVKEKINNDKNITLKLGELQCGIHTVEIQCANKKRSPEKFFWYNHLVSAISELFLNIEYKASRKNNLERVSAGSFNSILSWSTPCIGWEREQSPAFWGKARSFYDIDMLRWRLIFNHRFGIVMPEDRKIYFSVGGHGQRAYVDEYLSQRGGVLSSAIDFSNFYSQDHSKDKIIKKIPPIFHYIVPSPPFNGKWSLHDFNEAKKKWPQPQDKDADSYACYCPLFYFSTGKKRGVCAVRPFKDDYFDKYYLQQCINFDTYSKGGGH